MRPYFCCALTTIATVCARESGCGTILAMRDVERTKGVCMNTDGIAFLNTIISGRGQHVSPQAIDFELYDKNLTANLPTSL